jgi:hypothetical protein
VEFFDEVKRPQACIYCEGERIWWDGKRVRSATGRVGGRTVTVPAFPCRRVECATCGRSWTLLPPGLLPGRHFDLAVAAEALSRYLFEEGASRASVAEALEISPRTLGRFAEHTARVTTPGFLQKLLLRVTDIPRGAVHRADQLAYTLARLDCRLVHSRPYYSEGRGGVA